MHQAIQQRRVGRFEQALERRKIAVGHRRHMAGREFAQEPVKLLGAAMMAAVQRPLAPYLEWNGHCIDHRDA